MSSPGAAHPVTIIMVEDDEGHARLIERNLRRAGVNNELHAFADGTAALEHLLGPDGTGEAHSQRALLVLLDLNLPGTDGRQVLEDIKAVPSLRPIPVIVFTTSADRRDIEACYRAGANSYIQKPVDLTTLLQAVQRIKDFWFDMVIVPNVEESR